MTSATVDSMPFAGPFAGIAAITGDENVLILAAHPGDETLACGGLIAQCCSRGRPPYVMVLTDGSGLASNGPSPDAVAALRARQTRSALAALGLPEDRVLMVGLFDGSIPTEGPVFEAVVRAVMLVMWARDCNLLCAPVPDVRFAEHAAAAAIAAEVVARSGVGGIGVAMAGFDGPVTWRLDVAQQMRVKAAALAAHGLDEGMAVEMFMKAAGLSVPMA